MEDSGEVSSSCQDSGLRQGDDDLEEELNTSTLEGLQSDEQRRVLDIVAQLRKCGLESILSLPQLVVCGDQSAGKSSVLEALTEIPFPRDDNLCTRFATEIILRRGMSDSLTIKVIPDTGRPSNEQESIKAFTQSITNLAELPRVIGEAMVLMGLGSTSMSVMNPRAFAKDVLSVEIEGPMRPQLTLVDLPGLVQNETKGVTQADLNLVAGLTNHYISQSRTICLAVISATNDYANQGILTKVRKFDPTGDRTLGIITKPDRLPPGSGSEKAFIALARNEDIMFSLGWHVLKNRSYEAGSSSFLERNAAEAAFFSTSNFKALGDSCVGIDSLRDRLSLLLFNHIKQELPRLREDLDKALLQSASELNTLGEPRAESPQCKEYLMQLSLDYHEVCNAAIGGHYEGEFFNRTTDSVFSFDSDASIRRLRAVVLSMNTQFSDIIRTKGHKYHFKRLKELETAAEEDFIPSEPPGISSSPPSKTGTPIDFSHAEALKWVSQVLIRTRGRELPGNFNPLLVGELFWEQSSSWKRLAIDHVERVANVCSRFLRLLLEEKCPKDVLSRLWTSHIEDKLKTRLEASLQELSHIIKDMRSYPINYNHYYTDTIKKRRQARGRKSLAKCIEGAAQDIESADDIGVDVDKATESYFQGIDPDMENHSCEEALDCLFSIYKVSQKTFIANITTQVIERHIVRGLENIFSPIVVGRLSDAEAAAIASEPGPAKRQREFLEDRVKKLKEGHGIIRNVLGSAAL